MRLKQIVLQIVNDYKLIKRLRPLYNEAFEGMQINVGKSHLRVRKLELKNPMMSSYKYDVADYVYSSTIYVNRLHSNISSNILRGVFAHEIGHFDDLVLSLSGINNEMGAHGLAIARGFGEDLIDLNGLGESFGFGNTIFSNNQIREINNQILGKQTKEVVEYLSQNYFK